MAGREKRWQEPIRLSISLLVEVWDEAVEETSVRVNQQLAPADWQDISDNTLWERLIVFKANSTSASVKLWNTGVTSGTIVADAVRVREVGTVERTRRPPAAVNSSAWPGVGCTRRFLAIQ